jgi:hypothetical protein
LEKNRVIFIAEKTKSADSIVVRRALASKENDISTNIRDKYSLTRKEIIYNSQSLQLQSVQGWPVFICGLLNEELDDLIALIPTGANNIRLFFQNNTNNPVHSDDGSLFLEFSVGISYEDVNGNLGILMPQTELLVFGESIYSLVSQGYMEYNELPEENSKILMTEDNE